MLTVRFIGFFSIFRKGNMLAGALGAAVIFMALLALFFPRAAAAAQSGDEEEPAMIYHGRDMEGNRVFGTDHRAAPSFYTDPETGDRRFQTPPPDPSASRSGDGPEYIFVSPEVYPGGDWQNGQRPPDGKPGYKPGNRPGGSGNKPDGSYPPNRPNRRSLGPPPGGYPPSYDRPPTGGSSFIPRSPVWEGSRR